MKYSAKTHIGYRRKNNEDSYIVIAQPGEGFDTDCLGPLFAVADGMGGHAAGETASRMACEGIRDYYKLESDGACLTGDRLIEHLEEVVYTTHDSVYQHASRNRALSGMGTTLSVLVPRNDKALIAHVGDSRIYRLRKGILERLTRDHTRVQDFVDMGRLAPEEAATHHMRNIITQAVGVGPSLKEVFTRTGSVEPGDIYLICSDGLHDMIPEDLIRETLLRADTPESACDHLIAHALAGGGTDNVTVIVIRVDD